MLYCSCLYIYFAESVGMTANIFNCALLYTCRCPLVQYKLVFIHICSVYIFYVSISDCAFIICTYLKNSLLRLWRRQISVNPPVKL